MLGCKEFVNADEIAKGLSPFNPESVAIEAGRLMLQRMDDLLSEGSDFAFETTLSTRSYVKFIERAQAKGYFVTLLYFWLPTPNRLSNASRPVCERRPQYSFGCDSSPLCQWDKEFDRSLYSLCNYWAIYDNSSADEQIRIIALGGKDITTHIEDTLSYKTIADYERN